MKHVPPPTGEPLERLDNLAMAVPPQWGDAILRLAKATERVATKLDELPAITDGQYVAKARELAKSLIDFLDGIEDTDQDAAVDDEPCCDNELDDNGEDFEPSLGSSGHGNASAISYTSMPISDGFQMVYDCEGDEHDGAEPEDEGGEAVREDDEPSLGWTVDGAIQNTSSERCDVELQDHARVMPQERTDLGTGVYAETSYRRFLRGLTPEQQAAFHEAMRAGRTSGVLIR